MSNLLLAPIDWTAFLIVIAIVSGLAIVFSVLIVLISKLCFVKEDEKVKKITENLAGANCGGCGYAGCADYAKAIAEGKADFTKCGPTSNEGKMEIAKILGVDYNCEEQKYAVVHCAGGYKSKDKFIYVGGEGCTAQMQYMNGKKVCPQGCLGGGTCEATCPYHAITVKKGVASADKALCEACGLCVTNCPKSIVELIPKSSKVYIACSTTCRGKEVMNACENGCIGCGLCAKNCPQNAITMVNNLPVIDYTKCNGCKTCVTKCPRKCIREI